jgi:3-oxoacyl-[acyl-carrier-protein] synthase III
MPKLAVVSTGAYLPERRVSNDDLAKFLPDTSDEWIYSHTGIRARRVAAEGETASEMATIASRAALKKAGIDAEELGAIVLATGMPDYPGFPSTACLVQEKLGATNAGAFDMTAACSGFSYGLAVADGLGQNEERPILLVGSELMSRMLDWTDCKTCVLFGDGAGAVVLQRTNEEINPKRPRGVWGSYLGSKGSGARVLYCEEKDRSAGDHPDGRVAKMNGLGNLAIRMNGRAVFQFAVRAIEEVICHLLEKYNLKMDDIAYIVPHQANSRIIHKAASRLKIGEDRFFLNLEETANTSSASIPLALAEMDQQNLIARGDMILTVGFGAGLTFGGNLICW